MNGHEFWAELARQTTAIDPFDAWCVFDLLQERLDELRLANGSLLMHGDSSNFREFFVEARQAIFENAHKIYEKQIIEGKR